MDLWHISAIDAHAYVLPTIDSTLNVLDTRTATKALAFDQTLSHSLQSLAYQRSLRDIGELLECEPTTEAIAIQRDRLGFEQTAQRCFEAANLEGVILEQAPNFLIDQLLPMDWYRQWLKPYRLICLESLAEQMIPKVDRFDVFLEWFRSELDPLPPNVVGFKTIAASRSGLDIHLVYPETAEDCFYNLKRQQIDKDAPVRLQKDLVDFLLLIALDVATQHQIPLLVQTGMGDSGMDLRLANPLHLRPILEEPRYQSAPIVLQHGAYPFSQEAGFLASQYSQVYVDIGLAIPCLSVRGMKHLVHQLLESAPIGKILYSSSGRTSPETFYLAAKWGRTVLGQVLDEVVRDGDLTAQEAELGAIAILRGNAIRLYALPAE
ncbi:MAG: amidohydrolase family protein [Elainellaceae cyanobacterium]